MTAGMATFTFEGYQITVTRANIRMGLDRQLLRDRQRETLEGQTGLSLAERYLRLTLWPDLIACSSVLKDGQPYDLSAEDFMALPDTLGEQWADAVYQLNPHWAPGYAQSQQAKKKDASSALS